MGNRPHACAHHLALTGSAHRIESPAGSASDASPVDTALREAHEEIGLARQDATILGMLDDLPSLKNDMAVTPVVAHLAPRLSSASQFRMNEDEVARIFTIPLQQLLCAERWTSKRTEWQGRAFQQFYFEHDGETLYGLSAFATLMLLQLAAPEAAPHADALPWFKPEGRVQRGAGGGDRDVKRQGEDSGRPHAYDPFRRGSQE